MNPIRSEYESALRLVDLLCVKSSTVRNPDIDIAEEIHMRPYRNIKLIDRRIIVDVSLELFTEDDSFRADVTIRGVFELSGNLDSKTEKGLTERNTVAIIFPYLRSQISIITAQPGMTPIIIPAINVNAWFDNTPE